MNGSSPHPPYRADHVGSLLRPAAVKRARADLAAGRIDRERLREIENECIAAVVRKQRDLGLRACTDGELRRSWWHFDFLAGLDGVELTHGRKQIRFHGIETKSENIAVTGRVRFSSHPMLADFAYLHEVAGTAAKLTLPGPPVLHFRGGRESIDSEVYPDLDAFFEDTTAAYRKVLAAFYDAGCRYLQFDDTVWGYLCSEKERAESRARGDDPGRLPAIYADMINRVLADKPPDMFVTTHVCRGNFRSSWISEGGYEPVAETLLAGIDYDGYFLEYDTERAGGFEPLRFLPKGRKRVVLGLVTTKSGRLESAAAIARRIDEAARFAPLEQLCVSPQCGFASTEEGNLLTEDEQWRKLELVVDVARRVWADA
ncbi:MAG TPA: 5-methyltetrahydropteroyltriglutamate--homocysteine S-methyltransferase [Gammaproteobacteria bacterium]